ncbi:MAG: cupin domain-containing protein [Planctomycetota bacterium]
MDISHIPFTPTRHAGISIHYLHRDEASGNATAWIKMDPGCGYPAHAHRGVEEVLVVQGGYRDELGAYHAGDYVRYEDGSRHHPVALDDGPSCVLFAMTARGIERA